MNKKKKKKRSKQKRNKINETKIKITYKLYLSLECEEKECGKVLGSSCY
jgi:hypothetical protein